MSELTDDQQRVLDALRSRVYGQGWGMLRTQDDHYCCLGVVCDSLDIGEWVFVDEDWNFRFNDEWADSGSDPEVHNPEDIDLLLMGTINKNVSDELRLNRIE